MPETFKAIIEVEFNYTCDSGDGGVLFLDGGKDKEGKFPHVCSNKDDTTVYFLPNRYPRTEQQPVNLDIIPGLKIP